MLPRQIDEEKHLQETRTIIRANIERLTGRVDQVHQETEELNDRITPRDKELNSQMSQQLTIANALLTHTRNLLRKNVTAYPSPYFGRIDYWETKNGTEEALYVGKNGIQANDRIVVVDWRAPVAKVYYENELGEGTYEVPEDEPMAIDLVQKRTYDIENGVLNGFYDSDVAANDELLVKYLAKHKDVVLSDIIATIQKEQDQIIRSTPYQNIIVQGVAGSGKTTVALHRISHILYNYSHRYHSDEFLIIGSSEMLLDYIASGLPDLDVTGVLQRRMDVFFREELYEDWRDDFEIVEETAAGSYKCRLAFAMALDKWLEKRWLRILRPRAVDDEEIGEIISRDQVYDLLNYRRDWSLRRIENLLNQTLAGRIQMLTDVVSDEDTFKRMKNLRMKKMKEYSDYYHERHQHSSAALIYRMFLQEYGAEQGVDTSEALKKLALGQFSVYDAAALCLVRKYFTEDEPSPTFGQIIIDEAQDFGEAIYYYLKKLQKGCYFTIMGDVSQNIHFELGMNDWEAMTKGIFRGEKDQFRLLQKSYRNTIEISEFAGKILEKASGSRYKIEPVIRHGDPVDIRKLAQEAIPDEIVRLIEKAIENGHRSGAVVCRTKAEAKSWEEVIAKTRPEWLAEGGDFRLLSLPLEEVKGLEFDVVLLMEPTEENYPSKPVKTVGVKNAKLLYVAATRALHELHVLSSGPLSDLLTR
ncbi:MAG: ATP-binding domain-containing protein [Firmicutes bacterium]|nr:ATP-binding domain-containing protein [Bacillota bacterium]